MKNVLFSLFTVCIFSTMVQAGFTYTISDTYEYGVILNDEESLLVTGGGADQIEARDSSYVEVQKTAPLQLDIGGISFILLDDNSTLSFLNGETGSFRIYGNARAVFEGGRIDYIRSFQNAVIGWDWQGNPIYDPHIEIICRDYDDSNPNWITGIWNADNDSDGQWDSFSIQLLNQTGYTPVIHNIKFTVIPEPTTLALIGLGSLLIRRKRLNG